MQAVTQTKHQGLAYRLGHSNGRDSLEPWNINCAPLWREGSVPLNSFSHPRRMAPQYLAGYVAGREAERKARGAVTTQERRGVR